MPVTAINDIDLYIEDTGGTGRPVVLIHGRPMTVDSWHPQMPDLTQAGLPGHPV